MTLLHDSSRLSFSPPTDRPRLLVSVRNADEALAALTGGADILDIKEPSRGPLGLASYRTIQSIIQAVAERLPVSVAMGELNEAPSTGSLPAGVSYCKIGLADQKGHPWQARMSHHLSDTRNHNVPSMVAVAYWDHDRVNAPSPDEVLHWASQQPVAGILIDTADKAGPGLLTQPDDVERIKDFMARAGDLGLPVALAGKLTGPTLQAAIALKPSIIGVRSAACIHTDRNQPISADQVAQIMDLLQSGQHVKV